MCTSGHIKRFISMRGPHDIFTTRDLLIYGSRVSVDQAIYRLVKAGEIRRLARGVFVRVDVRRHEFTIWEVAQKKAESFGRQIITHAKDVARDLGLLEVGNSQITFATNGGTSSFVFGEIKIHFKKTSPKNMKLGDTKVGQVIRALSYLGSNSCDRNVLKKAVDTIWTNRILCDEFKNSTPNMPIWLVDCFTWFKNRSCIWHGSKEQQNWAQYNYL